MNRWNSSFRIKENAKGLKRTQIKRVSGKPLKRSSKPMKKVGRRTKDWRKVWAFLKPEFEKRGRTYCEFGFIPHECQGPLDPCHAHKRRKMEGDDIFRVALGCRWVIHEFLDLYCTHEQMEMFVNHAIELAGGLILPAESNQP